MWRRWSEREELMFWELCPKVQWAGGQETPPSIVRGKEPLVHKQPSPGEEYLPVWSIPFVSHLLCANGCVFYLSSEG